MAKKLVKIGLPSSTDKCIERWWEYRDMQDTRREANEINERKDHEILLRDLAKATAITQFTCLRMQRLTLKQ